MKIQEILTNQLTAENREQNKKDLEKTGNLRAGNAAYMLNNGRVNSANQCLRTTWLRWKGYRSSEEHPPNKLWMFKGGTGSEQIIAGLLKGAGLNVIMDAEYKIDIDGTVLSGRPDILLANADGKPVLGLELKKISSVWTAKEVINNAKPKTDHICQAAIYSYMVGVPYKLVYVQYDNYAAFTLRGISEEAVNVDRDGKGKPINLAPHLKVYDIKTSDDGRILYKPESGRYWENTGISMQGILDYYRNVKALDESSKLPARPEHYDVQGEKGNYTACKYCPYAAACSNFKEGADTMGEWTEDLLKEGLINDREE